MRSFVVTSTTGKSKNNTASKTWIWDSSTPLALGHPFRWIAERTENGIRIRDLGSRSHETTKSMIREIPFSSLEKGAQIDLEQLSLKLKAVVNFAPAFTARAGQALQIYCCNKNWVTSSQPLGAAYTAKAQSDKLFTLTNAGAGYTLASLVDGISISGKSVAKGQSAQISNAEIINSEIKYGTAVWRFAAVDAPEIPVAPAGKYPDAEADYFKKATRFAAVGFAAFMVMAYFWPKPEESKELVPAQFAQIVLSKPVEKQASQGAAAMQADTKDVAQNAPKKVQDAAVVQAFRAKALQNAVSGLLKGGMTNLLAQSDFVSGKGATADARRIFDAKSNSLKPTGENVGISNDKNVQVAALGGEVTKGGAGVGYGKGEHANVKGQGSAFVSMDIAGSEVQEGLTKDEVGEVIHRHLSEVRYCYESAMIRQPDIEGKLVVNFVIGSAGQVKSSEVKSSTLPDPRLDDCILRRLVTWKFPNTKGGIDVAVSYPFIFKTLGR